MDEQSRLISELNELTIPLETVDPAADLDDLEPLRSILEEKTVVGMGESSHGTREFFRFKHRLFRFLVEELDIRLLAWEANFAATMSINAYIQDGHGDPETALANEAIHLPFQSEAVLDLIEWMRAFNDGRTDDDKVKIHGFDMQFPFDAASALVSFLEEVAPDLLDEIRDDLTELAEGGVPEYHNSERLTVLLECAQRVVSTLEEAFDTRATAFAEASTERTVKRARQHLRTISQGLEQMRGDNPLRIRDEAMAENIAWVLEYESADAIAIWGHNAHIKRGGVPEDILGIEAPSLGDVLHRRYGDQYYPLGFDFGNGSCRVHSQTSNEFEAYEIDTPPAGSLPDVFGEVDASVFFFDTNRVAEYTTVSDWISNNPSHHFVVGSYEEDPVHYSTSNLSDEYGGLVFVRESTPSVPTVENPPERDTE